MKELVWHFPTSLAEAVRFLREPGVAAHAGGTGILRTGTSSLARLVNLHHLPLHYFDVSDGIVEMGAMLTFADVVEQMRTIDPGSILIKALEGAASTPLRNRITVGGSIAMAPPWSDLVGPLLALDADVVLLDGVDGNEGTGDPSVAALPITQYLEDRTGRKGKLVKAVRFNLGDWHSFYFRATVTRFDYAAFTIAALVRKNSEQKIEDLRLVVTGNKQRYRRLTAQEQALIGRKAGEVDDASKIAADAAADVDFTRKAIGSPDYVRHLFGVELERILEQVVRG